MIQLFKITIVENVKEVFAKINQNIQKSNDLFKKTKISINTLPNSISGLSRKLEELKEKNKNAFTIEGVKYYRNEIQKTEKELAKLTKIAEKKPLSIKNMLGGIGKNALQLGGAYLGINAISNTISGSIETLAEFERYQAVLTNTLGSQGAANQAMEMIKDFASSTPYQINELTNSFVKLANQGFVPSTEEMRKLGDLASSTGKSFEQLTEAILDAQTGEFERLKEFGITAQTNGDTVAFTFKGVTTQVQKSGDAIRQYLLSLGDLQGVRGSMASIMGTTGGMLSNMEDQLMMLKLSIGEAIKPLLEIILKNASKVVGWLTDLIKGLTAAINGAKVNVMSMSGAFKAAFNVTKFIKDNIEIIKILAVTIGGLMVVIKGVTLAMKIWQGITLLVQAAQWLLNIALTANPIGAIIVGITVLIGLLVYAWKHSEKFRGTVVGIWEAFKALAVLIKDVVVNAIISLVKGIGKIGEAIWLMLKGEFKAAWQSAKEGAVDIFKGTTFGVAYELYKGKDKVVDAFNTGYEKGKQMGGKKNEQTQDNEEETQNMPSLGVLSPTTQNANATNSTLNIAKGNSPSVVGTADKTSGRYLNINKLVEKIEIHTTNLKEGTQQMKEELIKVLLAAINDTYNTA